MDNKSYMELYESVEMVSVRLEVLHSMMQTLHVGMMAERMSKQTLDCVECIRFCVNDIQTLAENCVKHIQENHNNINKKEMA